MDEDVILFYNLSIKGISLYLLFMLKKEKGIEIIEKLENLIPEFTERTTDLILNYL